MEIYKGHWTPNTDLTEKAHCLWKQEGHTWIYQPSLHWNDLSSGDLRSYSRGDPTAVEALTRPPLGCRDTECPLLAFQWESSEPCTINTDTEKALQNPMGAVLEGTGRAESQGQPGRGGRPGTRWLSSAHRGMEELKSHKNRQKPQKKPQTRTTKTKQNN